jgi:HEAT repeat protein
VSKRHFGSGVAQPDDLVNALSGDDESRRVRARQHLPAFGVEAIQALIPLVSHENLAISRPARDVLMDIVNEVCAPGRDAERREACSLFISMIAAGQPHATRVYGLRLLAMAVPDGFDVKPIADLIADPECREKARVTLERIGTPQSRRALRAALRDADTEFTCALLASLGSLSDLDSIAAISLLASHKDAQIRLAAAHSLAHIGDPRSEAALIKIVGMASNDDRTAATHSLLLFADSLLKKHGDEAAARRVYRHVLDSSAEGPLRNAAFAALRALLLELT